MAKLPLAGIRILEFTVVASGPNATLCLADLGAEVLRIESTQYWPPSTRGMTAHPAQETFHRLGPAGGGYPNLEMGHRHWNRNIFFNCQGRNKYSFTVDLTKPEGRDIIHRLVPKCDVFVENNAYGTATKLGLDYDTLKPLRPDIIYVSGTGLGQTGPWRSFAGMGSTFEAMYGHGLLTGYPDMDPSQGRFLAVPSDATGAAGIAFAILAGLTHRNETGRGQFIDLSIGENFIPQLGDALMDCVMNGRIRDTLGNRDTFAAPQGCYPCKGDDEWIAITVASDDEWRALCEIMSRPELTNDARFADAPSRWQNHDELDVLIAAWTENEIDYDLFHRLQAAGVTAGPVLHEPHAYSDPHLRERGFFVEMTQAETGPVVDGKSTPGTHRYPGTALRLSETPVQFRKPPVRLGEDNEYVYKTLLGISDEEYARLEAEGHIGMDFRPNVPE